MPKIDTCSHQNRPLLKIASDDPLDNTTFLRTAPCYLFYSVNATNTNTIGRMYWKGYRRKMKFIFLGGTHVYCWKRRIFQFFHKQIEKHQRASSCQKVLPQQTRLAIVHARPVSPSTWHSKRECSSMFQLSSGNLIFLSSRLKGWMHRIERF